MASEKPKGGDKSPKSVCFPQGNEWFEFSNLPDKVADSGGTSVHMTSSVPSFSTGALRGVPRPSGEDMSNSFPVTEDDVSQMDVSKFPENGSDYLYEPVSHFQPLVGNINDPDNSLTERNTMTMGSDMAVDSQISRAGEVANDNDIRRPWFKRNQSTYAVSAPLSGDCVNTIELGTNNSQLHIADREARDGNVPRLSLIGNQFIHPGKVLGHSLPSGEWGMNNNGNVDKVSESNVSNKNSYQSTKRIALPVGNTVYGQNIASSSLSSSSDMVGGFSNFQNYAGGFSRQALNQSLLETHNLDGFSSLGQNAGGVSHHPRNVSELSTLVQNAGGIPAWMQNMRRFSHQERNIGRSSGLVGNVRSLSTPSMNESSQIPLPPAYEQNFNNSTRGNSELGGKMFQRFANVHPNIRFQGFPNNSSMPHVSNRAGITNMANFRPTGLPLSSSFVRVASDQLHRPHFGAFRNFSPENVAISPFIEVPRIRAQIGQPGQHLQGNTVSAAQVAESGSLGQNVGVQPATSKGQDIPAINMPTQPSTVSPGASRKRPATAYVPIAPKAQRTKTISTKPSGNLSSPAYPQIGPAAINSSSPRTHTVPFRFPLPRISPRPPLLSRTSPMLVAKHQVKYKKTPEPRGYKCYICKRDISFPPEGPIEQPEKLIPAAVLPCGHQFHDSCLQQITPENQAHNPPCIPCAMGED